MADKKEQKRFANIGVTKRDTAKLVDESIARQAEIKEIWAKRRPKTLAVKSNRPSQPFLPLSVAPSNHFIGDEKPSYWFPILCLLAVILVAIWTFYPDIKKMMKSAPAQPVAEATEKIIVPEPTIKVIDKPAPVDEAAAGVGDVPSFDIVRIDKSGSLVVGGRFWAGESVSVALNGKIIATIQANPDGEIAYAPKHKLKPGNYTLQLIADEAKSDRVFLYVDEKPEKSLSLLMDAKGSRVLQGPEVADGLFVVSKIDYLDNGRLVVQGRGIPRLLVSLTLNNVKIGTARVSDHKNFGLGARVGELESGKEYNLAIKLQDKNGAVISTIDHKFTMPEMTGMDDTFYVVRKGDCLWVIAKNFLGNGFRFSVIANANDIENPDLILPNQQVKIPTK